ncbi:MAG: transposase family protein [Akkermansiaceae bacterium]|nr:transposase family protein [Akkermansiaceae bacterium]
MKSLSGIMSQTSKAQYLENCRQRYLSRNRQGKSAMIDEVSDTMGWERKHAIKALTRKVSLGNRAKKRGAKPSYGKEEITVIVAIWKSSEQPCGVRLKATLPLWLGSYEARHGSLTDKCREKILHYSPRTLERITAPHRSAGSGRIGRKTGRSSNRIKQFVPIRCGPQEFDAPGWLEADTVSHGGGSSSGAFLWSLTLTDFHSGWTELAALWGNSGGEVRAGLERIEKRMPFAMLGFDCDNGSEFLNEVIEAYLLGRQRNIEWTRSRAYKKNDQAHVEQKNFTHVRQLLGYSRFGDIALRSMVDDLYEKAWLPLRNYFTPVMKLIEKKRIGTKVHKKYDTPATPCNRLLDCKKVDDETKQRLRATRAALDPLDLAADIERRLAQIFVIVERLEEDRQDEIQRAS